jgi:hypothetical protein
MRASGATTRANLAFTRRASVVRAPNELYNASDARTLDFVISRKVLYES